MAGPNYMHPRHKGVGILVEISRKGGRFRWESGAGPLWMRGPASVIEYYLMINVILTTACFRQVLAGNCKALRILTIQRSKSLYPLWPFSIEPVVTRLHNNFLFSERRGLPEADKPRSIKLWSNFITRPSGPTTRVKTTSPFGLDCFPEAAL